MVMDCVGRGVVGKTPLAAGVLAIALVCIHCAGCCSLCLVVVHIPSDCRLPEAAPRRVAALIAVPVDWPSGRAQHDNVAHRWQGAPDGGCRRIWCEVMQNRRSRARCCGS